MIVRPPLDECIAGLQNILLAKIDLLMPFTPDLCRSEHASRTTHVAEGGLPSAVGS